jgi:hypothetical protein
MIFLFDELNELTSHLLTKLLLPGIGAITKLSYNKAIRKEFDTKKKSAIFFG